MAAEDIYRPRVDGGATAGLPQAGADAFGAGVGAGLEAVGDAVGRIAEVERDQKRRSEALASGLEAERAKATIAKASRDRLLQPGGWAGFAEQTQAQAKAEGERIAKTITSRRVREKFEYDWGSYAIGLADEADATETVERGKAEIGGLDEQANLANGRIAANPTDATFGDTALALRESARATHAPPAVQDRYVAEKLEAFKLTQLDAMPPDMARQHLDSGAADAYLSPSARSQVSHQIDARIARAQSEARAQASQAKAIETEAIATAAVGLDAGRAEAGDWMGLAARADAIGDTSKAASYRLKGQEIAAAESYRGATPVERDRRIAALAAKPTLSAPEGAELKGLQGQARYVDSLGTLDRAAYSTGRAVPGLDLTSDASIVQRGVMLSAAQAQFGGVPDFFLPAEADQVREMVGKGSTDQRIAAAHVIARAGRFARQALDQVAGSDTVFRAAATLAPYGETIMRDALTGPDALREYPQLMKPAVDETNQPLSPSADQMFAGRTNGALIALPADYGAAVRINATNIYATMARKNGWAALNPQGYAAALNLALGGTRTPSGWAGGLHRWMGQPVVLPRGMAAADYERRIARASGREWVAAGNGVPWSNAGPMYTGELRGLTPVMVRDGIYRLRQGNSFVTLRDGRQFEVDLRRLPGIAHPVPKATAPNTPPLPRTGLPAEGGRSGLGVIGDAVRAGLDANNRMIAEQRARYRPKDR